MRILPAVAASLALALPAFAQTAPATITVTGEGRVEAVPDMATVMLGVTTDAATAREALDANNALLQATLTGLKSAGIEDRDVQTSGLSLGPRYDYSSSNGSGQIAGFTASNTVTVRVRAMDSLGEVLDAVVSDGANTLNGITFGMQNPEPLLDEARKQAVSDARDKAGLYATAAGVTIGPVVSISEQSGYMPPVPMAMDAGFAKAESVPVMGGEVALTANVTIVYELTQ